MAEYVLLESGETFEGCWRGAREAIPVAEAVFNTGLTGYQEILTDPSYAGQMVVMTYPLIGNYGMTDIDAESCKIQCVALIVREISEFHSNFASSRSLEAELLAQSIPCMSEVDTRALTRAIRDKGAMKATFIKSLAEKEKGLKRIASFSYSGVDFSARVSGVGSTLRYAASNDKLPHVAVLDFGIKGNILRILREFCEVEVFTLQEFLASGKKAFDGYFLSNGPGDPEAVVGAIDAIRHILDKGKPVFGICLGHQLLSLALGGKTYKLKFGHHGSNHPIKNLSTGKVEITSQNHGYAVDPKSFSDARVNPTHTNLNDGSLAGLEVTGAPVYSIQYHPEASPGPHDSRYLFERFRRDLQSV